MRLILGLMVACALVGCSRDEDPRAAVEDAAAAAAGTLNTADALGPTMLVDRMIAHARSQDWEGYLDLCGQSEKTRSEASRTVLLRRLEGSWGQQVLAELERADAVSPIIEDDRAIFRDGQGDALVLYRDSHGHWEHRL
ncbi:MAG: hypothetical protein KC729_20010 [Candidatus Eisenbacteria bacterium]|uniref:Lipoprotein n=1 Tax=Eiseniibacteriota bacterium TaxID=2212470 RepID=A0A956M4R1_UNCEI|nr:hypothetical protein [Candidatus Eisenbacteria bacterium]